VSSVFHAGSWSGTQRILSSIPLSSCILNSAIRLDRDHAAGERCLGHADHRVERVAVERERVRDEPVVGRIDHRREQKAVELDDPGLQVVLVLVAASLGDLDEAGERAVVHRDSEVTR